MSRIHFQKRRDFLKGATCLAASGAASTFVPQLSLLGTALAGTVTGYKALVCLYLDGGSDSFNMLIPADNTTNIPVSGRSPIAPFAATPNGPCFAIYLKQVCKLAGVSSVVDPGSLLFRCRDQLLLLMCFSSLIQPGIIRLSRFMDGLVQMLLTDLVPLTFLFDPAQDFLQLPREEFLHLIASWLSPERIALVETLPG